MHHVRTLVLLRAQSSVVRFNPCAHFHEEFLPHTVPARAELRRALPHAPHSLATLSAGLFTMLEQMKAKAKEGAHKAEVVAKSTKLKADILLLENKKKTLLMEFGKDVYPAMAAGDRATTETLFMTTKSKVEALEAEVTHKKEEIERLKHSGEHAATAGMAGMSVGPPPGGGMGPPPGAPPGGEPQLPPGWKSTLPPRPPIARRPPRPPPAPPPATAAAAAFPRRSDRCLPRTITPNHTPPAPVAPLHAPHAPPFLPQPRSPQPLQTSQLQTSLLAPHLRASSYATVPSLDTLRCASSVPRRGHDARGQGVLL